VGALLATAPDERAERRLQIILGASGAALIAFGFYAAGLPSIYRVSSFWTSSPTWFAIRVGVLMLGVSVIYGVFAVVSPSRVPRIGGSSAVDPLARLGRSSLFVYWIHVELVYGYTTWLIRGRLPLWGTAIAYVVFCVLMYCAIVLRDWLVDRWRVRRGGQTRQQAPPSRSYEPSERVAKAGHRVGGIS
jgi:fucose 4-O-acetylase-like acetyltransferase